MTSERGNFVLPYEPEDTSHWQDDARRRETREWLRQLDLEEHPSPPLAPRSRARSKRDRIGS